MIREVLREDLKVLWCNKKEIGDGGRIRESGDRSLKQRKDRVEKGTSNLQFSKSSELVQREEFEENKKIRYYWCEVTSRHCMMTRD